MSKGRPPSLQRISRGRQQEEFVGRRDEQASFRRNMGYAPDDERRRFIYALSGQGGVGKTALLRRFAKIAEEFGALTAWSDDVQDDIPQVLERIAQQFAAQGYPLKGLVERCQLYRRRVRELSAEADAPRDAAAFGRTLAQGMMTLAQINPMGKVALAFVNKDAAATQVGEWAQWVAKKLPNKEDVQLVLEPLALLTPPFLESLWDAAEQHPVTLFFDTYEATGAYLDPWLRDLLDGRYGEIPGNILLCLAGRDDLDRNAWSAWEGLTVRIELQPFSDEETRDYAARKGVKNAEVVEAIRNLSGGLPLLVATLASTVPDNPGQIGDPSDTAVERCLKWVAEPELREAALNAALPRELNRDVLAQIVGEGKAGELYNWLRDRPFVQERGGKRVYHPLVRGPMLRYKHRESPQGWAELHGKLAEYYERLRDGLGLKEEGAAYKDETWQCYALEALYHRLCQSPRQHLPAALNGYLGFRFSGFAGYVPLGRWAEVILQAGQDGDSSEVRTWGERLVEVSRHRGNTHWEAAISVVNMLLSYPHLDERWHPWLVSSRIGHAREAGQAASALRDANRAVEQNPSSAIALRQRSWVYRHSGHYEEALADCRSALELDPGDSWLHHTLALTYWHMGLHELALPASQRANELGCLAALGTQPAMYLELGRYAEALTAAGAALQRSRGSFTFRMRGQTYRRLGRFQESLDDLNTNLQHESPRGQAEALYQRALTYQCLGQDDQARTDLRAAIGYAQSTYKDWPQNWYNLFELARCHLALGEAGSAEKLCREAIAANASPYMIGRAVRWIDDLLTVYKDNAGALAVHKLLMAHLDTLGFDPYHPPVI